jgi:hypothetical protein
VDEFNTMRGAYGPTSISNQIRTVPVEITAHAANDHDRHDDDRLVSTQAG